MATAAAWIAVASTAATTYSAYSAAQDQKQMAKNAAKPQTTTVNRTPYANEYISQLIPYILQEADSVYHTRAKTGGREAGATLPGSSQSVYDILAGMGQRNEASRQAQYDSIAKAQSMRNAAFENATARKVVY